MKEMAAPVTALTATPVRMRVTTSVRPARLAITYTPAVVARPHAKARTGVVHDPRKVHENMIDNEAPTAAPDETPTVPGSARGLPKIPCMIAPATASEAPTTTAIARRGKRTFHSASSPKGVLGAGSQSMPRRWRMEPSTSEGGTRSCPRTPLTTTSTTSATASTVAVMAVARAREGAGRRERRRVIGSAPDRRTGARPAAARLGRAVRRAGRPPPGRRRRCQGRRGPRPCGGRSS